MSPEVEMRAASTPVHQERCPDCRNGLVCAEPWEAWFAQLDEAEAGAEPRDEQPDCEPEIECPSCGGTGLSVKIRRSRETNHRQTRAA
jgi:hypothetical protein